MSAITVNLSMVRGDTQVMQVTVSNLGASGLNAFSDIRFTAKRLLSDPDSAAIMSKTLAGGVQIVTPGNATTNGVLAVTITPADTQGLATGLATALSYDVRVYDSSGDAYTVAQGVLTVNPTATQATT